MKFVLRSLALAAVALLSAHAMAQQRTYIYSQSNSNMKPNRNTIFAFSNDGFGNLAPVPGSPYPTGGAGVSAPSGTEFDADQEVVINKPGNVLYAVNGHSNSISAFAINSDGTLTTLPGSPFPSGGQNPVSIGLAKGFLVVANKNEDPRQNIEADLPNYTTFKVNPGGGLTMNAGSTVDLPQGSSVAQALIWERGHMIFGLEFLTSRIATYRYDQNGIMTELDAVTPVVPGNSFLGEILHPTKKILYAGLLRSAEVAVYTYDNAGAMSHVNTVPNEGADICWLQVNTAGTRLYSSESLSNTMTVYDISNPTSPVQIQRVNIDATDKPLSNIALDPSGKFIYALSGRTIHALNVDANGLLNETSIPIAMPGSANETPLGLAVVRK